MSQTPEEPVDSVRSDSFDSDALKTLFSKWFEDTDVRRVRQRPPKPRMLECPFLKNDGGKLRNYKNQVIANAEIGGFLKCIMQNNEGQDNETNRLEPQHSLPEPALECIEETEGDDDDEDIKRVNVEKFITNIFKGSQLTWRPSLKWKTRPPRRPRRVGQRKNIAARSLSPCSSTSSCLSPDKSPFARRLDLGHLGECRVVLRDIIGLIRKENEDSSNVSGNCLNASLKPQKVKKLLQRKKGIQTKTPTISTNPTPIQDEPGEGSEPSFQDTVKRENRKRVRKKSTRERNMDCAPASESEPMKTRQTDESNEWLEDPGETRPNISVSTDQSPSAQVLSMDCDLVNGIKQTKKRKKHQNNESFEETVDSLPEVSVPTDFGLSTQERNSEFKNPPDSQDDVTVPIDLGLEKSLDFSLDCAPLRAKKKRRKEKNSESLAKVETSPEVGVYTDPSLSSPDYSMDCASENGIKHKKKRKKDQNNESLSKNVAQNPVEPPEDTRVQDDDAELDQEKSRKQGMKSSAARSSLSPRSSPSRLSPDKSPFDIRLDLGHLNECSVVLSDIFGLIRKKNEHSLNVSNGEGNRLSVSLKPQKTQPSEMISARDVHQEPKETTFGNSLALAYASTGSSRYDYTSPPKEILMEGEKEKMKLFNYVGLKLLKRKKGIQTKTPTISTHPTPLQDDPGEGSEPPFEHTVKRENRKRVNNKLKEAAATPPEVPTDLDCAPANESEPMKTRQKDESNEWLEDPGETRPNISVSTDPSPSAQVLSMDCALVNGIKPKKKRKKHQNNESLEETVNSMPEIGVLTDLGLPVLPDISLNHSSSRGVKKRTKEKNNELLEETVASLPEVSASGDPSPSAQVLSMDSASVNGIKAKKKRKKGQTSESLEETLPEITLPRDLGLPVQDLSLDHSSSRGMKKRKKEKNNELLEKTADSLPEVSVSRDPSPSAQVLSMDSASVNGIKPKKRKKKGKTSESLSEEPFDTQPIASVYTYQSLSAQGHAMDRAPVTESKRNKEAKKHKMNVVLEEPVEPSPESIKESSQDHAMDSVIIDRIKHKKKRKKDKNSELLDPVEPLMEVIAPTELEVSAQNCSLDCSPVKKKKKKKHKMNVEEPVDALAQVRLPTSPSDQDSSAIWPPVGGSNPKKKRKQGKMPPEDELTGGKDGIHSPHRGSASLASIAEKTEPELPRSDLSSDEIHNLNSKNPLIQSHGLVEPRRKKKKGAAKSHSSPTMSDETVASESRSSQETTSVKKKKKKKKKKRFMGGPEEEQEGTVTAASETIGEPSDKLLEGVEIQTLKTDDSATSSKKKRQEVKGVAAAEPPGNVQESGRPAAEIRKKKNKKNANMETSKDEEITTLSLGLSGAKRSNTPSTACETGGIGEGESLGGTEPEKKKKKKKRKESDVDGLRSGSQSLGHSLDTEQTAESIKASSSRENLGEGNRTPPFSNDTREGKKHKKGDDSRTSQQVPQLEDALQAEGKKKKKKKKKKRLVETSSDADHEIIEDGACQEMKKKKKKRIERTHFYSSEGEFI